MTEERTDAPERDVQEAIAGAGARPAVDLARRARVRGAVHQAWRQSLPARKRRWWPVVAAAAAAAILIIIVLIPRGQEIRPVGVIEVASAAERSGRELRTGEVLRTGAGNRLAIRLAGGGSLRVDQSTELALVEPRRFELRSGAVYFDSAGSAAPITVATNLGEITDIGTQFEVRGAAREVTVRVREGSISLASDGRRHRAGAGSEVRIDEAGKLNVSSIAPNDPAWSWVVAVAPPFELEGANLDQFLTWSCRELGCRVEYSGGLHRRKAQSIVLHGAIRGLRPDQALTAILPTTGTAARMDGATLRVEMRR